MKQKTSNIIIKTGLVILVIIASLLLGFLIGRQNQIKPETIEYETKIAIVNNDQGVSEHGETIFYTREFLKPFTTNSVYEFTTINNAKSGLQNNTYSGYLIIPENFSKNIASLSTTKTKATLLYSLNNQQPSVLENSIIKINDVINTLDQNVASNYVSNILNNVNNVSVNAKQATDAISENTVLINGIVASNWFKPLDIKQAQILSLNDQSLKAELESLGLIDENITKQINDQLGPTNEHYQKIINNIETINNELNEENYLHYSVDSLPLIGDYQLKATNGQKLDVYVGRKRLSIYVKYPQSGLIAINYANDSFSIQGVANSDNASLDYNKIISNFYQVLNQYDTNSIQLYGHNLVISGNNIHVVDIKGKVQIIGANKVVIDGNVYYPQAQPNANQNLFEVVFNTARTKQANHKNPQPYLQLSASIINRLHQLAVENPQMSITEALTIINSEENQLAANCLVQIEDFDSIESYVNTITPKYFIDGFNQYLNDQEGLDDNQAIALNPNKEDYIVNISGPEIVKDTVNVSNNIIINDNQIFNQDLINQSLNNIIVNFETLIKNGIKGIDYTFINTLNHNIDLNVNNLTNNFNQQIQVNDQINQDNLNQIHDYEQYLNQNISDNIDNLKQVVIANNNTTISVFDNLGNELDYMKHGNTIDDSAVDFIVSSIDSQLDNIESNKDVERSKSNKVIVYSLIGVGLIIAIGGVSYVIYRQKQED
mgnify:FL=1